MPLSVHSLLGRNRPSPLFYPALYLFNLFPLHAPITLYGIDAPYGRFSGGGKPAGIWRWLYLNGPYPSTLSWAEWECCVAQLCNLAWFLMEVASPVVLLKTLIESGRPLSPIGKLCAGLFCLHYLHRSILSPLVYSPKRSDQHIIVTISAGAFNMLNAYLIACSLAFFPATQSFTDIRTIIGVTGFLTCFAGNVYHDEVLNDLRRPREKRLVSSLSPEEEKGDKVAAERTGKQGGRYLIPRAGLFRFIAAPNYFCEILEWTFFAILAAPPPSPSLSALPQTVLLPIPALNMIRAQAAAYPQLATLLSYMPESAWPTVLVAPPYLFALNAAANMIPRAIRGLAWYRQTFGERFPKDRKAVVPFLL